MIATVEDARHALTKAASLRPPADVSQLGKGARVGLYEDYMLKSAFHRAELEECVMWMRETQAQIAKQWEEVDGYESFLPAKPSQADMERAKRQVAPGIHAAGREVKRLVDHCLRQIERFEHEEKVVISRCYSMISGA